MSGGNETLKTGKYQVTKTIRFKLEPESGSSFLIPEKYSDDKRLKDLIDKLERIKRDLDLIIYTQDKNGDNTDKLESRIKIKYRWLRSYIKQDFYNYLNNMDQDSQSKLYAISKLDFFIKELKRWAEEWNYIIDSLKTYNSMPDEESPRKSEIALVIKKLLKKSNFYFIKEFAGSVNQTNIPAIDDKINALNLLCNDTEKIILNVSRFYLPAQSDGIIVAGGSFNYYTVNKTKKFYQDQKEKQEEQLLQKVIDIEYKFDRKQVKLGTIYKELLESLKFTKEEDGNEPCESTLLEELKSSSLSKAYDFLKKWKADLKSEFIKKAQKKELKFDETVDGKQFYLFEAEEANFNKFITLTNEIEELNIEYMGEYTTPERKKAIKDIRIAKRQERGNFFNSPKNKKNGSPTIQTDNYYKLCELYKKIAQKRGQVLARIKAIKKEAKEAEQLKYWCFIVEKEARHFVYMIPNDGKDTLGLGNAKKYIDQLKDASDAVTLKLYYFKSLTLSALRKLCFKTINNSFICSIKKNWIKLPCDKKLFKGKFPRYEQELSEQDKINFYKDVLKIAKTTGTPGFGVDLSSFDEQIDYLCDEEHSDLESFESELHKICYVKKVLFDENIEKDLKEKFNAISFTITSYDLQKEINEDKKNSDKNINLKEHTKIWKHFWEAENKKNSYPLRLNPEIKITWREPKQSRVDKYGSSTTLYDPKKKNRYLYPQFTLMTTFTNNAFGKKFDAIFTDTESIKNQLDKFNKELALHNTGEWYYGIDRGEKELATLCIVKFSMEEDEMKPEFPDNIELYELKENKLFFKDEKREETSKVPVINVNTGKDFGGPIKNLSYFMDKLNDEKWFIRKRSIENAAIDLTTAKIINGKIILNADIMTFLTLKKTVAKRKLFELFHLGKINQNSIIKERKNGKFIIVLDTANNEIEIYNLKVKGEYISKELIVQELIDYLKNLDLSRVMKNEPPIEKINHLRDAITSNMVGVINFLMTKYRAKSISLENLDEKLLPIQKENVVQEKFINAQFAKTEIQISRRLEWALYRKLQNESLVPPGIKETILLKDDFNQQKFGVLQFVQTAGTSKSCPKCGKENDKKSHYRCKASADCFASDDPNRRIGFESLTNSDKVAAYNIAKRGFESEPPKDIT